MNIQCKRKLLLTRFTLIFPYKFSADKTNVISFGCGMSWHAVCKKSKLIIVINKKNRMKRKVGFTGGEWQSVYNSE